MQRAYAVRKRRLIFLCENFIFVWEQSTVQWLESKKTQQFQTIVPEVKWFNEQNALYLVVKWLDYWPEKGNSKRKLPFIEMSKNVGSNHKLKYEAVLMNIAAISKPNFALNQSTFQANRDLYPLFWDNELKMATFDPYFHLLWNIGLQTTYRWS